MVTYLFLATCTQSHYPFLIHLLYIDMFPWKFLHFAFHLKLKKKLFLYASVYLSLPFPHMNSSLSKRRIYFNIFLEVEFRILHFIKKNIRFFFIFIKFCIKIYKNKYYINLNRVNNNKEGEYKTTWSIMRERKEDKKGLHCILFQILEERVFFFCNIRNFLYNLLKLFWI